MRRLNTIRMMIVGSLVIGHVACGHTPVGSQELTQQEPAASVTFDIPAQPLIDALIVFSAKTGMQVLYEGTIAQGVWSPGATGTITPTEALHRLLRDTGLSYRTTQHGTVTLERGVLPPLPPASLAPPAQQPLAAQAAPEQMQPVRKPVRVPEILVKDVRGREDDATSYVAEESSTATRTETPLIQVPQ